MQVFVLGMHRSGTSAIARILNLMGLYFGEENSSTGRNAENEKGFWERSDVRAVSDTILFNAECDWDRVSKFDIDSIPDSGRVSYTSAAANIVLSLDAHRPWFIKEPRLCMLFPIWREVLETPFCVHIQRNPLEVAHSLKKRNKIPIRVGLALWEFYNTCALASSKGLPRTFISYETLMSEPMQVVKSIYSALQENGGYNLRIPDEKELSSFLDKELYHQRKDIKSLKAVATANQLRLYEILEKATDSSDLAIPPLPDRCIKTLGKYDESVDIFDRIERRNDQLQRHKAPNMRLQLTIKNLELKYATEKRHVMSSRINSLTKESQSLTKESKKLNSTLGNLEKDNARLQSKTDEIERKILIRRASILSRKKYIDAELPRKRKEVSQLDQLAGPMLKGIEDLLCSNRWRLGDAILSSGYLLLFRSQPVTIREELSKVMTAYQAKKVASRKLAIAHERLPAQLYHSIPSELALPASKDHKSDIDREDQKIALLIKMELANIQYGNTIIIYEDFIDNLARLANTLLGSRRWRMGNALLSLRYKVFFLRTPPTAANTLSTLIVNYNLRKNHGVKLFDSMEAETNNEAGASSSRMLSRTPRSTMGLTGKLCADKTHRAISAVLPYYIRYVPRRIRHLIPEKLRNSIGALVVDKNSKDLPDPTYMPPSDQAADCTYIVSATWWHRHKDAARHIANSGQAVIVTGDYDSQISDGVTVISGDFSRALALASITTNMVIEVGDNAAPNSTKWSNWKALSKEGRRWEHAGTKLLPVDELIRESTIINNGKTE